MTYLVRKGRREGTQTYSQCFIAPVSGVVAPEQEGEGRTDAIRKRKSIAIELEPGDILLYQGPNVAHWRDTLMGDYSYHMFIHFYMTKGAVGQNVGEEMAYDWIGSKYLSTEQRPAEKTKRQIEWNKAYSITKNESSENNFDEYTTEKIEDDSI